MDRTSARPFRFLAVFAAISIALIAGRAAVQVTHGLRAQYFENPTWSGLPFLETVDSAISVDQVSAAWLGTPPSAFSVRWFGYLMVPRTGQYIIGTRSDDGSFLSVDGSPVVDNGGTHGSQVRTGSIYLARGPHAVLIDYQQSIAEFDIGLLWNSGSGGLTPLPAWRLSPNRVPEWRVLLARSLDLGILAALAALVVAAVWIGIGNDRLWAPARAHPRLASLVLFAILAVAETWPLAAHPERLSRNDNGDTILNEWAIAWVVHQAPRAPFHLFDGNIFYPERRTLAYSEAMIVQSAMAAPLLWLGASPVLAYNIVLMAGFALTGWAMALVIASWTGSWSAGVTSGILYAFNAHNFARMPHLQNQHVEFFPFALFALDRLLAVPRLKNALRLSLWFVLQALTSMYLLVFTAISLTVAALARPGDWLGTKFRKVAPLLAGAAAVAAIALTPYLLPYWHLSHEQGLSRTIENATGFAAGWQNYLSTPSRIHYPLWSYLVISSPALFPGAIALLLAGVALIRGVALSDPRARMCLAFGVVGVILSFGTYVPGYAILFRFIPLFQAIRAVSRFGYLGIIAVAVLAGFGVAELRSMTSRKYWMPMALLIPLLAAADGWTAPVEYTRFEGIPAIYRQLKDVPHAVVAELPMHGAGSAFLEANYMLHSTVNWQPIVNGYSGLQPGSYYENADALQGFPDAPSIARLRAIGVTHLFVHLDQLGGSVAGILDKTAGLHRVATEADIVLYRLDP